MGVRLYELKSDFSTEACKRLECAMCHLCTVGTIEGLLRCLLYAHAASCSETHLLHVVMESGQGS